MPRLDRELLELPRISSYFNLRTLIEVLYFLHFLLTTFKMDSSSLFNVKVRMQFISFISSGDTYNTLGQSRPCDRRSKRHRAYDLRRLRRKWSKSLHLFPRCESLRASLQRIECSRYFSPPLPSTVLFNKSQAKAVPSLSPPISTNSKIASVLQMNSRRESRNYMSLSTTPAPTGEHHMTSSPTQHGRESSL